MNKLSIIFYLINIVTTQIYAAPPGNAATVYDVLTTNFSKSCPVLSTNVLVDSTTKYLSTCKDVSIINKPEQMNLLNMNKFYCIGMLTADLQLCNIISNNTDISLPKNFNELQGNIDTIQKIEPENLCTLLQGVVLFGDIKTIPSSIQKSVLTLKEELSGPHCPKLCSDLIDDKSNELCSMLYYIHVQISNVSKAIAQKIPSTQVKESKPSVAPVNAANTPNKEVPKQEASSKQQQSVDKTNKIVTEHITNAVAPNQSVNKSPGEKAESNVKKGPVLVSAEGVEPRVEPKKSETPPKVPVNQLPNEQPNQQPNQQPIQQPNQQSNQEQIPDGSEGNKNSKIISTVPAPVVGKTDSSPQPVDTTKLEQPPLKSGEDQAVETKTGVVTNPNDPKINPEKFEEPLLPEESEYDPSTTSESTNVKPNSENDDFIDDDEDDEEKEMDDTNPEPQKNVDESFINSRNDLNPNMKDAIDVEESNFFSYFMFISVMFIAGYVVYHNKQKIMALVLEGRRDRNSRRRPSTSSYRKLNSNLEEAVTSKCSGSASHVIY